jgi:hypothetical protein
MIIKKFIEFIDESYLSGSRQPLYHITSRLQAILVTDLLKCGRPSRASQGNDKSISLTRNIDFTHTDDDIIELDNDKLRKYGIKSYPVDEWAWKDGKRYHDISKYNFSKSNFKEVKAGRRGTKHNLNLPKEPILETEFEERIYQDIPNLGKYLISLNFTRELNIDQNRIVSDYLKKYPHIKIYLMDENNRRKRTEITSKFILKPEVVKVNQ